MEDMLINSYCSHAIKLSGIDQPIYAVLIKIGDPSAPAAVMEPKETNLLIKPVDDEESIPLASGICLNDLLDILQYDINMGQHDLVILQSCPCEQ